MDEFNELPEALPTPVTLADLWGKLSDESAQKLHDHVEQLREEWERDGSVK